ncbi:RluA family pseudouridine synthase [Dinghuibacter silviterrae]|uniref:Pseudouridine synthase n=1 Tax=Dinghuibacter silviterrae TaxID=1539049 RepID=A0A4R8DNC8_9BACT|nr:RluA family pseudouridine synthase [Dinghuibacter silviterrae]TDW99308.1 23S rRNA pseudouridine955/2504/2580 synthase/23S rRNA pseudouridine1911/1915/1917 synthase [Dinghuibacter silviterrae]
MQKKSIDILADTPSFIAVHKPSGMLSIPDREQTEVSLRELLNEAYGKVFTVHRLDRDTSGVIVFAKTAEAHQYFSAQFEGREVRKYYLGFVHGQPVQESGTIDGPIMENPQKRGSMIVHAKGKPSLTDYTVLESFGILSLVQFQIHTGRTHQVRVHSKDMGHPIVVDPLYGDGQPVLLSSIKRKFKLSKYEETERPLLGRLALHAWKIGFTDPEGQEWEIEAPLPKDMAALLNQLRKWKG